MSTSNWSKHVKLLLSMAVVWAITAAGGNVLAQGVSISSGGTPSYAVPIGVPPGIAGMAPNLSLLYSGGELNGPVGLGWSLQGMSSITRCASNKQADGVVRAVSYTANDKLCLDGQRLIQVKADGTVVNDNPVNPGVDHPFQTNDSLGGDGMVREYRTEKDIYARIRAYGAAGGDPANGPAYFKVWTKSGQIFEYGINANTDSQARITATGTNIVTAWPVSRISDTLGNFIDFFYWSREKAWGSGTYAVTVPGKEWNLNEIHYTGHGTALPANKILFEYEERTDLVGAAKDGAEAYHLGSKNISLTRLKAIRTFINWPADQTDRPASARKVKTYKIAYDQGPQSGRSRVTSVTECGGEDETTCLPSANLSYSAGGGVVYAANSNFTGSGLGALPLRDLYGTYGVLIGNFYNSGRTDILRWSDDPAKNLLYRSVGDGTFQQAGNFNLTDQNLFRSDGCYEAIAADFDGDGATDILRIMKANNPSTGASCGTVRHVLYHSNGDGSFTSRPISGIDLTRLVARRTDRYVCSDQLVAMKSGAVAPKLALPTKRGATVAVTNRSSGAEQLAQQPCTGELEYVGSSQTAGQTFHLIDTNSDGLLDIIVTSMPAYPTMATPPSDADLCASLVCTHVYLGQPDGSFVEKTDSNVVHRSLYVNPGTNFQNTKAQLFIGDMNGDGLADLLVDSGTWYSRGNGDFDLGGGYTGNCSHIIDFNGDGNNDCLIAFGVGDPAIYQSLYVSDGLQGNHITANFNLKQADEALMGYPSVNNPITPNMDFVPMDMDGDGKGDVLRWADDPSKNAVFLSNGDGTFRHSNFNLTGEQLQKSDGTASFVVADFTGHGNAEILRFKVTPDNTSFSNALFTKADTTPPDQLSSVVGPTGLKTQLTWVPLSYPMTGRQDPRYYHDFNTPSAARYPLRDLVLPMQVVATVTADTGVGGQKLSTDYLYAGLKASWDGVMLGFREVRQQTPTSIDGKYLTILNEYLQDGYNTGVSLLTRTWIGDLWGTSGTAADIISETWNVYCDKTSAAGAEATAYTTGSCIPGSRVRRPYLYISSEVGWDQGKALPSVQTVNAYDNDGNTTAISSATTGTALEQTQKFTKVTTNTYYDATKTDDSWILGRLKRTVVASENRSTPVQQPTAALVRARPLAARIAQGGAADYPAQNELTTIGVIYARDVVANVKTSGGATVKLSGLGTTAGSAPYATATHGTAFNLKVTPNPLKVFPAAVGKASATLTASLSGGTPPYSYTWTQLEGNRTSLSSTTIANPVVSATLALGDNLNEVWRLRATDAAGASAALNVPVTFALPAATLTAKFSPTALTLAQNDPGEASAVLAPIVAGGITPYTYAWTRTTGTRSSLSDVSAASPTLRATLAAGDAFSETWKVTVTDSAGKSASASIATAFSAPAVLKVTPAAARTVTVGSTGTASSTLTTSVAGGKSPYTYSWVRTGGTLSTVANATVLSPVVSATLIPGQNVVESWTVTVTDAVGHTASGSTDITFSYPPAAMALHFTPTALTVSANDPGVASGQLTSVPSGGVQPYTYAWTHTTGTRSSLSDLAAPNPLISATLVAGDSFSEQWKLTVTDSRGSSVAASITTTFKAPATLAVTPPVARAVTVGTSNTTSSTLTPSVAGGVTPYTYSWQRTGGDSSTVANATAASAVVSISLVPGQSSVETWTVTVTDAVGHTASGSTAITFNNPGTALGLSFNPSTPRTDAPDAGVVSVQVTGVPTGGIPPFSYAWVHGTGTRTAVSNASVLNPVISATLGVGETVSEQWKLTVTDAAAKTITGTVTTTLTTPAAMVVTLAATRTATASSTTAGLATTAVTTLSTTGGRAPYTYSWSRIAGSRSTASNPAILGTQFAAQLDLGETISETWQVTVSDAVGHSQTANTVVTFSYPAPALQLSFTPSATLRTDAPDPGLVSAAVTGVPKGGIPPYSYAWTRYTGTRTVLSDASSASPAISATLNAGETVTEQWRLTVTDTAAKTISALVSATLTAPAVLDLPLAASKTATATSATNGVATIAIASTATGGRTPYTYSWTRIAGSRSTAINTATATATLSATVALGETIVETWRQTVTDSVGHVSSADVAVTFTYPPPAMAMSFAPTALSLPLNDPGVASGSVTPTVSGGIPPYSYSWAHTTGSRSQVSNAALASPVFSAALGAGESFTDVWTLTATDTVGKTVSHALNVAFSSLPLLTATLADSKTVAITATSGLGSTTMPVTVSGGKAPYTYSWVRTSGGSATLSSATVASPTLSATLAQGQTVSETWQVTVRDAVGHTASDSTTITFNYPYAALTVKAAPTTLALTAAAPGPVSGVVNITASGGVAPYAYSWTHTTGTASQILSGGDASVTIGATLSSPTYFTEQWKVDVTDSRGAKGSTLVPVTFNLPGIGLSCFNDSVSTFHCNVLNQGGSTLSSIGIVSSDTSMSITPGQVLSNCAAKSNCGSVTFHVFGSGHFTGTITFTSLPLKVTYPYDLTVP